MCLFRMDLAIRFGIHAAIIMQFLWEHLKPEMCIRDRAYRAIKEMFCGEVKVNEGSEDNRHM